MAIPLHALATGSIAGAITDADGEPIEGVRVTLYGTEHTASTDAQGEYIISNLTVAAPRYILVTEKAGYLSGQHGNIDVVDSETTEVDFVLTAEENGNALLDSTTLKIGIGLLMEVEYSGALLQPADDAVLDPDLYPDHVLPYLGSESFITPAHPAIRQLAADILATVPAAKRRKMTVVAKAVYDWMVTNINYDGMKQFPGDVTSGNWQTTYGGWGRNFTDWCYTPVELLEEERGICIEFERLTSSLLRALKIPARPAPLGVHPVTQWWNQSPDGSGFWVNMETSDGNIAWAERGDLWAGFPSVEEHLITYFGINGEAPIHMDWNCRNNCIWKEFGGQESFELASAGLKEAEKGLQRFLAEGTLPQWGELAAIPLNIRTLHEGYYLLNSRGVELDLSGMQGQERLTVKFPLFDETKYMTLLDMGHWTDHPEWLTSTFTITEYDEQTQESLEFQVFLFNLPQNL